MKALIKPGKVLKESVVMNWECSVCGMYNRVIVKIGTKLPEVFYCWACGALSECDYYRNEIEGKYTKNELLHNGEHK